MVDLPVEQIIREVDQGQRSFRQLGDLFGVNESTIRRRYHKAKAALGEGTEHKSVEQDPVDVMRERLKRQDEVKATTQVLRAAAKEKNFREFLSREFRDLIPKSVVNTVPYFEPTSEVSVETAVFHWSDFHLDEIVKKESVLGLNEYNQDIALKRAYSLIEKSLRIVERMESGGWYIPEAVVGINGDMITGLIHGLEKHTVTGNVVLNAWLCAQVLRDALLILAARFPFLRAYFTPGNHTRFENEKNYNEPLRTWDTVIALMVQEALRDQSNVEIHIPDSYLALYQVEGHNILQTHGEELSSQFGISTERMVQRMAHLQEAHYFLLGHWHQTADYPALQGKVLFNGSLIGGNAYSLGKLGKMSRPEQGLHFFKADKGLTSTWTIYPELFPKSDAPSFGPYLRTA